MRKAETVRFRPHQAITVAALVTFVGALPLVFGPELPTEPTDTPVAGSAVRWYLLPVLLIPVLVALWAVRSGTDANPDGLRLRAFLGQRWVPWPEVAALGSDDRGRALVQLHDGHQVRLPAVRAADLPRLVEASGQQLDRPDGGSDSDGADQPRPDSGTGQ